MLLVCYIANLLFSWELVLRGVLDVNEYLELSDNNYTNLKVWYRTLVQWEIDDKLLHSYFTAVSEVFWS